MKRYKCLVEDYNVLGGCLKGVIYNEDHTWGKKHSTVKDFSEMFPNDWELVEEFTLPENWCIIRTSSNYEEINKWARTKSTENFTNDSEEVFCLNGISSTIKKDCESYTEITFEQFEKYVLMKDTKEIIGYKLKEDCKQYLEAAEKIADSSVNFAVGSNLEYFLQRDHWGEYKKSLSKAKVLDLWFEPIYKETKTLPKINGYKGEITQISGIVKYGCAQLSSEGIESFLKNRAIGINRKINSITLESGVEITIEQLQQIVDYFKD